MRLIVCNKKPDETFSRAIYKNPIIVEQASRFLNKRSTHRVVSLFSGKERKLVCAISRSPRRHWLTSTECLWLRLFIISSLMPPRLHSHLVSININAEKHKKNYSLVVILKSSWKISNWRVNEKLILIFHSWQCRMCFRLHLFNKTIIYSLAISSQTHQTSFTIAVCVLVI